MLSFVHLILLSSFISIVMCHVLEKRHNDFQERFMERRRQREINDQALLTKENELLNDIEVVNDVTHYLNKGNKSSKKLKKIETFEKDFRRLLAMDGMKYYYKRDFYWRTWRRVVSTSGADEIVSYKCNNIVQGQGCQNCGMWTIEERPPPCPYEFFAMMTDKLLCGASYTQYTDKDSACPSIINFSDLTATCDNPIETKWRFTKMYGGPENSKSKNIICDDEDTCEILTSYEITPDYVIFRIINSTNDVIYSRIMKPNYVNYICIDDCGRFNENTRKVRKIDKPLKLNLLITTRVNKNIPVQSKNNVVDELNVTMLPKDSFPPSKVKKVSMPAIPVNAYVFDKDAYLLGHKIKSKVTKKQPNNLDLEEYLKKHFIPRLKLYNWKKTNKLTSGENELNSTDPKVKIIRWQVAETRITRLPLDKFLRNQTLNLFNNSSHFF